MGSGSSKESKAAAKAQAGRDGSASAPNTPGSPSQAQFVAQYHPSSVLAHRQVRGSRPELSFLSLVRDRDNAQVLAERPRELKPEREARRLERERLLRLKEREWSVREEHVDGGYLVTLGTYTGVEDFDKAIVRQLQIERRLAPFWRGLNDHSTSWTEAQLVAAARLLPIPAPDEIPPEMARTPSEASSVQPVNDNSTNSLTIPITSRSLSHDSTSSANFSPSPSRATFSGAGPASLPLSPNSSSTQLFRGRAKTLASLASGSKNHSPDLIPQEMQLPKDPNVYGQPIEAYLYKDASECPICFMYYPPYLNKTRCCDQPICSECFVQIKRPEPHPPEHEQPGQPRPPEEEAEMLVSEVASCPFCVTPEFGVTYDPPPFRRGLSYAKQPYRNPLTSSTSAMSSSSSLHNHNRRRTMSLSANAPQVITTDRVRPDWAKKLADARTNLLRRSAAATALHNAAYVLGNYGDGQLRGNLAGFRQRRSVFNVPGISPSTQGGLVLSPYGHVARAGSRDAGEGSTGIYPARSSSRRVGVDDLEELMMMEAMRLSLIAEEERQRKEEKVAKKDAKKRAKDDKKEAKLAEKSARKGSTSTAPLYPSSVNGSSSSTWASGSMLRSNSNLDAILASNEDKAQGKGKAPAQDFAGFIPLTEPTSTLNTEIGGSKETSLSAADDAQRYLEESRANFQPAISMAIPSPSRLWPHTRQFSDASSIASSFNGSSAAGSIRNDSTFSSAMASGLELSSPAAGTVAGHTTSSAPLAAASGLEPMLNFRSLAAMVGDEDKTDEQGHDHIENTGTAESKPLDPTSDAQDGGDSQIPNGDSPPVYDADGDDDQITPAAGPRDMGVVHGVDSKEIVDGEFFSRVHTSEATQ